MKAILLALLLAVFIWPPTGEMNMKSTKTALQINASHLHRSFYEDVERANLIFVNKVIEVSGILKFVDQTKEGDIRIALETKNQMRQIICILESKNPSQLDPLHIGHPISIKGICEGLFTDVIIDHGIILL